MKKNLLRLSVFGVLATAAVYAQNSTTFQVNVPFDFIVGSQTLHAGQYTVDQKTAPWRVILKGGEPNGGAIVMGLALYPSVTRHEGNLVFHRYGDTYFLSQVWAADSYGRQVSVTRQERELIARRTPHENTAVAAVR
jgi:hypothetical protein